MTSDNPLLGRGLFVRDAAEASSPEASSDENIIQELQKLNESVLNLTRIGDDSPNPPPFQLPAVFPTTGGIKALPAGDNIFDFRDGEATLADGSTEPLPGTQVISNDHLLSLHLFVDTLAEVSFFHHSEQSGFYRVEGPLPLTFQAIQFDQFTIRLDRPADVRFVVSPRPEAPVTSLPLNIGVNRYSAPTITAISSDPDDEKNIGFVATGGGIQSQSLGKGTIFTKSLGSKTFLITGDTSTAITAVLQVLAVDGQTWFDDPDTNGTFTINANTSYVLESSFPAEQMRLQMYVGAGLSANPKIQFFGSVEAR